MQRDGAQDWQALLQATSSQEDEAEARVPGLTILFHPDVDRVGERAELRGVETDRGAELARRELDFTPPGGGPGQPLGDPYLSRRPVRFSRAQYGGVRVDCADSGTRVVANGDWIHADRVFLGVEVERGVVLVLSNRIVLLLHNLRTEEGEEVPRFGLVGESPLIVRVRREIQEVAATAAPVLLLGEVGTGKKAIATAIHRSGERRDGPFLAVNLAARTAPSSPEELLAGAAGGTLYLDAIDKMSPAAQEQLLRAQGSAAEGHCSAGSEPASGVRILVGTDLESLTATRGAAAAGPLLRRCGDRVIELPSLRKRRDDMGRLLVHFLRQELREVDAGHCLADPGPYAQPWFPVQLVANLMTYEWPANVCQLRRVVRHLVVENHQNEQVRYGPDLDLLLEKTAATSAWDDTCIDLSEAERRAAAREPSEISEVELLGALRSNRWMLGPTAEELGITPEVLNGMIAKFSQSSKRRRRAPHRPRPF